MNGSFRRAAALALLVALAGALHAEPAPWGLPSEARIAAEAATWAPPDFKKQLAKHSRRLMDGVGAAAASDRTAPRAPGARNAAARIARELAASIRRHDAFSDVAYKAGALVHAAAQAYAPDAAPGPKGPSAFLGFGADAFADPEAIAHAELPDATDAARRAAAVTLSARLFAWVWKTAGGDVSLVKEYPASKGPYSP